MFFKPKGKINATLIENDLLLSNETEVGKRRICGPN